MQATFTREGHNVGVFIMTRDGEYEWDCSDAERDRFEDAVKKVIEDLREPYSWSGYEGNEMTTNIIKPGDPRWFDRVLARLQNEGYEHVVLDSGQ
jgi:hypothetical protein